MYSQFDLTGYMLELGPDLYYPDLTQKNLWGYIDDWNDEIESISPTRSFCIFADHIHMPDSQPGSRLIFNYSDRGYMNLYGIGWSERISSVRNFGNAAWLSGVPWWENRGSPLWDD
jgi:hypothetical protein